MYTYTRSLEYDEKHGTKTMLEENGETRASRDGSNKCESCEYARANIDVIHTNTRG